MFSQLTAIARRKPPGFQNVIILGTGRVVHAKELKKQAKMRERRTAR